MQIVYSEIEQEIVDWLNPLTNGGGVEVFKLPEVQSEFERPMLAGRITIAYKSSDYGDIKNVHHIVQDEKIHIEVIVQARLLRGDNGIHKMIEAIKRRLLGFSPTDCSKMYLVKNGFTEHNNESGVWSYSMIFECKYLLVENHEYDLEPTLEELTFIYNAEDTHVVIPPVCEPVTIYNSESTVIGVEPAGGAFELPDEIYDIYVNGLFVERFTIPALANEQITITA